MNLNIVLFIIGVALIIAGEGPDKFRYDYEEEERE